MARPKKTRSSRLIPLLVIVVAVVAAAVWYRGYAARRAQPHFETRAVKRGDVEQDVLTTGNLQCVHTVAVGSQVSGIVQKMYVDFNSLVHKGQIVARVDPSTFETQREQAQAQLDSALAGVSNAEANVDNAIANLKNADAAVRTAQAAVSTASVGIRTAEAQLRSQQSAVGKAQTTMHLNQLTYERDLPLLKRDMVPASQVDADHAGYQTAAADVQTARSQVDAARTGVDSARVARESAVIGVEAAIQKREAAMASVEAAKAQLRSTQQTVKQQEANLKLATVNLNYCVIRSPVDGVVIARNIDPGQTIAASLSAPQLYLMGTDLHHLQVLANLDESDIAQVYQGQQATFTVDAYPSDTFKGVVSQVRTNSTIVNNVVTYQLLIDVDNPKLKLLPSMTANVSLLVRSKKDVVLVPSMALRFKPDEAELTATPTPAPSASASASASPEEHHHHHHRDGGGGDGQFAHRRGGPGQMKHQRVWVLQDNHPVPVEVTTGITDGTNTEVVSGLSDGQQVIVTEIGPLSGGDHSPAARPPRRMF